MRTRTLEGYVPKNSKTGRLIFYSLGNFVFDQYFSKETQTGLTVGLELSDKEVVFRLFPVKEKLSRPELMNAEESAVFLKKLSEISDKKLTCGRNQKRCYKDKTCPVIYLNEKRWTVCGFLRHFLSNCEKVVKKNPFVFIFLSTYFYTIR